MTSRRVKRSAKDSDGDIIGLCGDWGQVSKATAIRHIEGGQYRYYVRVRGAEVDVIVAGTGPNKYLTTEPDYTTENNLDELPDCTHFR